MTQTHRTTQSEEQTISEERYEHLKNELAAYRAGVYEMAEDRYTEKKRKVEHYEQVNRQ